MWKLKAKCVFQVAAGLSFTVFLTRHGHVYSCGSNTCGQLGHGDTLERPTPKLIEQFESVGPVAQIAAGPSYVLTVTESGAVYSFGSGQNFCLGHGEQHNELQPRQVQSFRRRGIHVVRVSAGDEHAVALDSNGLVSSLNQDSLPFLSSAIRALCINSRAIISGLYLGQRLLWCIRPWR